MDTGIRSRRGRPFFILSTLLLSASALLGGCSQADPEAVRFPTVPPQPTFTRIPTVTLIPGGIPPTGELFPLLEGVTRTPVPTLTPIPTEERYDPLSPTQTAAAAQPTQPLPVVTVEPEFKKEEIPTGTLTGGVLGLIPSPQGLWAMRSTGTQMTLLTSDPIDAIAIAPAGTMGVYLTHPDPNTSIYDQPFGYMLKLITLYDDRTYPVAVIDPPGISAGSDTAVLDSAVNALNAYTRGALSWSPNGARVAFVSSQDAQPGKPASSDVYLYTPSSGNVQRLTTLDLPSGPAHAYDLQWSPDGLRLYFSAAYTFSPAGGSGGTWIAGSWAAGMDGSLVQLYDGSPGAGFNMIEWLPGNSLLADTPDSCGARDLRVVRLSDGTVTTLWPGCYTDMIYDRQRAEVIVSVTAPVAAIPGSAAEGLYRVRVYDPTPQQIAPTGFEKLYAGSGRSAWYGYNNGQGIYAISRAGAVSALFTGPPYDNTTSTILKPMQRLAFSDTWLFTGASGGLYRAVPGRELEMLLDVPVEGWTTSPSLPGLHFFFAPGDFGTRLYGVREKDWQPFPVDDRLRSPMGIRWVP